MSFALAFPKNHPNKNLKKPKKLQKQNSQQKEITQTKSTKANCEFFWHKLVVHFVFCAFLF